MLVNNVLIREATPDDARALLVCVRKTFDEPDNHLVTEPDEFTLTEDEERTFITRLNDDSNGLLLVAEHIIDSAIVGNLMLRPGERRAERHVVMLGIAITHDWRSKGVGTRMMEQGIRWARQHREIHRIELQVLTRNTGAINLYSRMGFQIEGTRRGAVKKHKVYLDSYIMALLV